MEKNWGPKIIAVAVILVMLIPIFMDAVSNTILTEVEYDKFNERVVETSNYDFALFYVAPSSDDDIKDQKNNVKKIVERYTSVATNKTLMAFYIDSTKLSDGEKKELLGDDVEEDTGYVIAVNGEVLKTFEGSLGDSELDDIVQVYSTNAEVIPKDMVHYKTLKDAKEFTTLIKDKKKVNMFVFGRDSCFYCNQFRVVYNTVIEENDIDNIYYIDSDTFDSEEYDKIMDSGLMIPAKCNSGTEKRLQEGFGTPLTLFTKNGKVIDCIGGYTNKSSLLTQLKTVGILKAD